MSGIELRRLQIRDLTAIEAIERTSYPTPWSRSMFAGELAKPSSICLGAFDVETDELLGYLIISRYVDAWHVMNVAVSPGHRRRGVASGPCRAHVLLGTRLGRFGHVRCQAPDVARRGVSLLASRPARSR